MLNFRGGPYGWKTLTKNQTSIISKFFPDFSLNLATLFFRAVKRKIDVYVADFTLR